MQANYRHDKQLFQNCCTLIDTVFPGAKALFDTGKSIGVHLDDISTPFIITLQNSPIAHIGVLTFSISLNKKNYTASALHAVCTLEAHRHQGYFKKLMNEAMEYARGISDFTLLYTDHPNLYLSHNFKVVEEFDYLLPLNDSFAGNQQLRLLSLHHAEDFQTIRTLYEKHIPLSERLQVQSFELFVLNCLNKQLYYADEHDVLLVTEPSKVNSIKIQYILCSKQPSIEELLTLIPAKARQILFQMNVDILNFLELHLQPQPADTLGYVMVNRNMQNSMRDIRLPEVYRC